MNSLRTHVPVSRNRRPDIALRDPVQTLGPAGIVRGVRTGVGTSGRVRLDDQEVSSLTEVVVDLGSPAKVERDRDRNVLGGSLRMTELVTAFKH